MLPSQNIIEIQTLSLDITSLRTFQQCAEQFSYTKGRLPSNINKINMLINTETVAYNYNNLKSVVWLPYRDLWYG